MPRLIAAAALAALGLVAHTASHTTSPATHAGFLAVAAVLFAVASLLVGWRIFGFARRSN